MTTPLKEPAEVLDTVWSRRLSVLVRMHPRVERNLARLGELDHAHRGAAALQAGPACPILDGSSIPDGRWPSLLSLLLNSSRPRIRDGSLIACMSAGSLGKPQLIGFEYDAPTARLVSSAIFGAE
jgi:hypothetical protein